MLMHSKMLERTCSRPLATTGTTATTETAALTATTAVRVVDSGPHVKVKCEVQPIQLTGIVHGMLCDALKN